MTASRMGLTVAAIVFMAAAPAVADQPDRIGANPEPDRAAELQAEAEALFPEPAQWKKAVRLLEASAELRGADDPAAYECLLYAGRIQAAIGDHRGARSNLEKAAEHALARGDIAEAANAFIDAAHAAVALKDARRAQDLVDRAGRLARSPLLPSDQRAVLESRLSA